MGYIFPLKPNSCNRPTQLFFSAASSLEAPTTAIDWDQTQYLDLNLYHFLYPPLFDFSEMPLLFACQSYFTRLAEL